MNSCPITQWGRCIKRWSNPTPYPASYLAGAGYGQIWKFGRISAGAGAGYDIRCNPTFSITQLKSFTIYSCSIAATISYSIATLVTICLLNVLRFSAGLSWNPVNLISYWNVSHLEVSKFTIHNQNGTKLYLGSTFNFPFSMNVN